MIELLRRRRPPARLTLREELRHDPVVDVVLPEDGSYLLKVHDFLFRGGPEYVYRLSAGSLPYIDYVMPPAGVAGTTGHVHALRPQSSGRTACRSDRRRPSAGEIGRRHFASERPPVAPAHTTLGSVAAGVKVVSWVLKTPAGESNPVLIQLAPSVPVVEKEPNDTPATAQAITAPGEFAGQFQSPGDTDYLTFHADAGQVFYIDVFADRVGSTADPVSRPGTGRPRRKRQGIDDTHHFDGRRQQQHRAGSLRHPHATIRRIASRPRPMEPTASSSAIGRSRAGAIRGWFIACRFDPEEPDFQLVVLPQYPKQGSIKAVSHLGPRASQGGQPRRRNPRASQRRVSRADRRLGRRLPHGVSCRGAALASNAKTAELIFTAAENAPEWSGLIRVFGKARLSDRAKVSALAAADAALNTVADAAQKVETVAAASARAAPGGRVGGDHQRRGRQWTRRMPILPSPCSTPGPPLYRLRKAAQAAAQSLAAVRKKLDGAQAAQRAAAAAAVPLEIVHEAIPASIVWSAALDVPAVSRIGQSLALSVMKESAPFQLSTDVARVEVNQEPASPASPVVGEAERL